MDISAQHGGFNSSASRLLPFVVICGKNVRLEEKKNVTLAFDAILVVIR